MPLPLHEARARLGLVAPAQEPRRTSSLGAALLISLSSVFAVGCSADQTEDVAMGACLPDRATYDTTVEPLLVRYCGACHGGEPSFGAPFGLLDYDGLLAGRARGRRVDEIVSELSEGSMPPAGTPRVPLADAATLLARANCGETVAPVDEGLVSSAPPLLAPIKLL
jgi:hypothetical protein